MPIFIFSDNGPACILFLLKQMPQTIKLAYILICLYSVVLFFVWLNNYLKLGLKFDLSVYTALLITPYVFPSDKITYTVLYSCVGFVQDQTPNSALDNTGKRFTRKTTFQCAYKVNPARLSCCAV